MFDGRRTFLSIRASILLGLSLLALSGCRTTSEPEPPPLPISGRVTWEGRGPVEFGTDSSGRLKIHTLVFQAPDTLRLRLIEYPDDVQAYQAFQAKSNLEELRQGYYREGSSQHFFQGPYLAELHHSSGALLSAGLVREKLLFQGESLFQRPRAFQAFPIAGQIPQSERILTPDFLGGKGSEALLAVAYQCHQDTAWLFRSSRPFAKSLSEWLSARQGRADTLKWGREIHFSGILSDGKPVIFWIFKGGVLGVWGCYDPVLAQEYAEKLKKTTILLEKP